MPTNDRFSLMLGTRAPPDEEHAEDEAAQGHAGRASRGKFEDGFEKVASMIKVEAS